MRNKRLVNIHKMGSQFSSQHMLIEDKNACASTMTFFSYETPIYEVTIDEGYSEDIRSFITQFEFYNYMRIFFPQFLNFNSRI